MDMLAALRQMGISAAGRAVPGRVARAGPAGYGRASSTMLN